MVGKRFNMPEASDVVSIMEYGKYYYYCGGEIIHEFATVTPHLNVPIFMVWTGNDYSILDIGPVCGSIEEAISVAESWAKQHQTYVIFKEGGA